MIQRRKRYFIDPEFQKRYISMMILTLIVFANIMILLVLSVYIDEVTIAKLQAALSVDAPYKLLLPILVIAELIGLFIVGAMSLIMSHRMAGPIYRLKMDLKEIEKGDLSRIIKFREKDEFQDVAVCVNGMLESVRVKFNALSTLRETVKKMESRQQNIALKEELVYIGSKLDAVLSSLKLA